MEITSRLNLGHVQHGSIGMSWWSGLLHQPLRVQHIEMPHPGPRDGVACAGGADDDWDHLWTDLGGEG
jgi:hypothetical protein